jgi:hypothetical protein
MHVVNIVISILLIAILFVTSSGQDEPRRIGSIDFYGYAGLNLDQIRSALPLHVGDRYPGPFETLEIINKAVSSAIGRPPTDMSPVCCDSQGNYMIYVGLPGTSIKQPKFNPAPKGKTQFPPTIVKLYEQTMAASRDDVSKGNAREDTSKGYALSTSSPKLRAKQLAIRAYAIQYEKLIRSVLDSSSAAQQRVVAAYLLGYARQSKQQIAGLVRASYDTDEVVRNNATRALGVLSESRSKLAARIPASRFIEMLSSGSWTDRNKAGWVLSSLSKGRDPKVLARLRSESLVSLLEMARWRNAGHAHNARLLLARIAGIEEKRAMQLANAEDADEIINSLRLEP